MSSIDTHPHAYATKYRPAGIGTVPPGFVFLASGSNEPLMRRPDLRRSDYAYGVIGYAEPLTAEQVEAFELIHLPGWRVSCN